MNMDMMTPPQQLFATIGKSVGSTGVSDTLAADVRTVVTRIIGIMAVFAVIFVVVGGVQYLTSAGDASKTEKAKRTIIYSLIGLIVCALAFVIVQFVVGNILK